jgi:hypothetical protein
MLHQFHAMLSKIKQGNSSVLDVKSHYNIVEVDITSIKGELPAKAGNFVECNNTPQNTNTNN